MSCTCGAGGICASRARGPCPQYRTSVAEAGSGTLSWLVALHVAASEERRALRIEDAERLPPGPHSFVETLRRWTRASRATLALRRLDRLSAVQLERLPEVLEAAPVLATARPENAAGSHGAMRSYPGFTTQVYLPPLRERLEDVEPLLRYFLGRYGFPVPLTLSREAWRRCLEYGWPGNEREVSMLGARLAATYGSGPVGVEQLARVAPEVAGVPEDRAILVDLEPPPDHRALERVLRFLRRNFRRSVTLAEAARAAYVSRTHLAHLFRQEMDTTFLEVLTRMRLARACQLLRARGARESSLERVAEDAGFSSLRQMERGFRRHLRVTPSSYRRKICRETGKIRRP